ncbi:toll/interleukin-1 receptor domain-containing protein [Streptomyces sp. DSM 44915]|uniref:Toll/interleukin-1 receptor domain-containing protein n=1 Tax=Streptomyces chisholmiae TaxID=3075540 RepID=A0ABU2JMR3_9ACTN|nr:toll/interleukin-1 receptor domain-containing protein [Streptomyces sp. DSM 44915]MDT0266270.1 toll/interleukin-1 receptor domain-containing protein [Streptomyces sp. DSM 44915]
MDLNAWGVVIGAVGAIAGVVSASIEVYARKSRRKPPAPAPAPPAADPSSGYDVFISYTEADSDAAESLGSRLRAEGLTVFLARWIGPGLVESLEKEEALGASANGLLVFSGATMRDTAIRDEYAALLQRVHSGGRRFIPVLVEDVDLPPFARIRRPVDLRDAHSAQFDENIAMLVRAVRPGSDAI